METELHKDILLYTDSDAFIENVMYFLTSLHILLSLLPKPQLRLIKLIKNISNISVFFPRLTANNMVNFFKSQLKKNLLFFLLRFFSLWFTIF